ncbi:hypothetical protein CLOP_g25424 [Closterium sp. NIES-67]|nr:hypothetical protein CLOP_g25424 [Closterium sp. NIES-67]
MNFSHDKFDAEKYVDDQMQIMDERGVRLLVGDLADYRRVSADEMRKSVFANYTAFIGTSKEIAELEVELQQMKNLLSLQTNLIHSLAADSLNNETSSNANSAAAAAAAAGGAGAGGGSSTPASTASSVTTAGTSSTFAAASSSSYASSLATPQDEEEDERLWSVEVPEPTEIEKYAEALPDILDILIAERKVDRAIELLEQGQQIEEEILSAEAANALATAIADRRAWLVGQLEETAQQAAVRGQELRQAVGALYRLGETERAHQLLLAAYGERIRSGSRLLRPRGTSFGGAYTAALAQLVFSAISQAATDSARIFASDPSCAADLLLWAQRETEFCVSLLKRHVLSSAAAAGGLHAAAECVRIALGHCRLLEDQGLTLSPVLSKLVRPSVEEALEFNIIRIEDSVATMVAVDDWVLLPLPHGSGATGRVRALQQTLGPGLMHLKLSSSGQKFYMLLVDLVEDILPVISLQLFGRILDRLASLFESYVALLQKALPSPSSDDDDNEDEEGEEGKAGEKDKDKANGGGEEPWQDGSVRTAEDEQQQLALLGNASALADDLLPRLAQRLTLAAGEEGGGGGGGGRGGRKQGGAEQDRRLSGGGGRNAAEHKEWRRRLQKAVDKLRDVLCSCLVAEFMYGDDGKPILTAHEYLHMDAKMRPTQWALKPLPSPPFQALYMALHSIHSTATYVLGGRDRALYMALHSIHSTATYVLGGRDRVVTLLLMRLAEWLMMGLMVYSTFWDELENAEYALGPTGLQQLVFDMYFVMQVAKAGKYSSRAMRKVAEDSATKAIVLFTDQTGGDPNSLLQEDWWYEHKCLEAIEELAAAASPAASPSDSPSRHRRSFSQEDHDDPLPAASSAAADAGAIGGAAGAGGVGAVAAASVSSQVQSVPSSHQPVEGGLSQQQQRPEGRSVGDEDRRPAAKTQYDASDDDGGGGGRSARAGARGGASRSSTSEGVGGGARSRGYSGDDYASSGSRNEYSARDRDYGRDYGRDRDSGGSREYGRDRESAAGGWDYGRDSGGREYARERDGGSREYGREGSYGRDRGYSERERDRDGYGREEGSRNYSGREARSRRGGGY